MCVCASDERGASACVIKYARVHLVVLDGKGDTRSIAQLEFLQSTNFANTACLACELRDMFCHFQIWSCVVKKKTLIILNCCMSIHSVPAKAWCHLYSIWLLLHRGSFLLLAEPNNSAIARLLKKPWRCSSCDWGFEKHVLCFLQQSSLRNKVLLLSYSPHFWTTLRKGRCTWTGRSTGKSSFALCVSETKTWNAHQVHFMMRHALFCN